MFLVILIGFYITAYVFSHKGRLVVTYGKIDKIILTISSLLIIGGGICGESASTEYLETPLNVVGLILLGISIYSTIRNNIEDPVMVIIAVLAKIAILVLFMYLVAFTFFMLLMYIFNRNNNKEFKGLNWIKYLNQFLIYK